MVHTLTSGIITDGLGDVVINDGNQGCGVGVGVGVGVGRSR